MFGLRNHDHDVRAEEAHRLAGDGHRIVDVREHHEFAAGHAPGALHIPLRELPHRLGELDRSASWLAICRSGGRSMQATALLRRHGLDARNVAGGMSAWLRSRLPVRDIAGGPGRLL